MTGIEANNRELPLISVVFVTYRRVALLRDTCLSLQARSAYPIGRCEYIVCDDGSPADMQAEIRRLPCDEFLLTGRNEGIGKNTNKGLRRSRGQYVLQLQDDWRCVGRPDFLEAAVELFEERPDVGLIRLRAPFQGPAAEWRTRSGRLALVYENRRDWRATTGDYVYTDTPHIKRRVLHERLGYYRENQPMHKVELDFCRRFEAQQEFRAAFLDGYECFEHTGSEESFNPLHRPRPWRDLMERRPATAMVLHQMRGVKCALRARLRRW